MTSALAQITASPTSCCSITNGAYEATGTANGAVAPTLIQLLNPSAGQYNGSWTLNLSIGSGSSALSGQSYAYWVLGAASPDTTETTSQASYTIGPTLNITNAANLSLSSALPYGGLQPLVPFPLANTLQAVSYGADGYFQTKNKTPADSPVYNGALGGAISITNTGSLTINATAPSGTAQTPWAPYASAINAISIGGNGVGGKTNDNDIGGNGGNGGTINITTNAGSQITLSGAGSNSAPINGITAYSQGGGSGCDCSGDHANVYGSSGTGGTITINHNGSISSTASNSIGISAVSIGGDGGLQTGHGVGASPGTSGSGGAVNVTIGGGASISLSSSSGIGILAASSVGPSAQAPSQPDIGGGPVTVTINQGATIASTGNGTFNIGVAAISTGSPDILQPFSSSYVAPNGAGLSGPVSVTNNGTINTSGQVAVGIAALSIGGDGVLTSANTGFSTLGNLNPSAANYTAGGVTVANGGSITTNGSSAFGVLAEANGSGGLVSVASNSDISGNSITSGVIVGGGQGATNNGNGGAVSVTNTGVITTGDGNGGGKLAIGIVAQSIGGGGGSSGGNNPAVMVGGQGGNAGSGGNVTVSNGGQVLTRDNGAIGILAQSVGGGGGNGGNAAGIFVAVGGAAGDGGAGNQVNVNLTGGQVATEGNFAAGVIAQSVGGGGGNGGYATAAGLFISGAIGGSGGAGGNISVTNAGTLGTLGQDSLGLLAQSVGGGGGNGGAAISLAAGALFTVSLAAGGTGGKGGSGGTVSLDNTGRLITTGPDSIAMIGQSIGGGGGTGGASMAQTLAISVPEVPTFSFGAAMGGAGNTAGNGGQVTLSNTGSIVTTGDGAHGILAQSIGGGGGNGGDSTAASHAIAVGAPSINLTLAAGASGGAAGNGGTVNVYDGAFSNGSFTVGPVTVSTPINAAVGGTPAISTGGANAAAVVAQSIGGGGGNSTAGNATNSSANLGSAGGDTYKFNVRLGASGGAGGTGGAVNIALNSGATLETVGSGSPGILAQSISGGGGSSSGGSFGLSVGSYAANVAAGGNGIAGQNAGTVTVATSATITTLAGDSIGILAQSIAGGGGLAGSADAAASISAATQVENSVNPPSTNSYTATVALGGIGGTGGAGGTVDVGNSGAVTTSGERAYGIEAQSIGGGGGNAGTATSGTAGTTNSTYSANVSVGSKGGVAGDGGNVNVYSSGPIQTSGYNAYGILAQSIGGGGGVGGDGSVNASTTISLGAGIAGTGGGGGTGGAIVVQTVPGGTITTSGSDASAIVSQSIGGGGGTATAGCGGVSCLSTEGIVTQAYSQSFNYALNVGGNSGASGNGYTQSVTVGDAIHTNGPRSMGIVAQSIGGGGGFATAAAQTLSGTTVAGSPGSNNGTGGTVSVTLQSTGSITTSGAGSWGILAQSIGGGGGFAGDPSLNIAPIQSNTLSRSGTGDALASTVTVNVNGNITTSGTNAHGIFAQAIGGSGGIVAGCCQSTTATLLAGNTAQFSSASNSTYWGDGGAININQGAGSTIQTSGPGSIGIIAQSSGNNAAGSQISITVSGTVIGGTNTGYNLAMVASARRVSCCPVAPPHRVRQTRSKSMPAAGLALSTG